MTTQQEKRRQQYEALCRKDDAGTITDYENWKAVRLYYELHPEQKTWNDARTPAQVFSLWAYLCFRLRTFLSSRGRL